MSELSRLANMAEILSAMIVVGGIIFAIIQMRQTRQQRRELAAIELFRSYARPAFTDAYLKVLRYPDGISAKRKHVYDEKCAMIICTTMENIGVMMYQRIVPSAVVNNLIGSSAVVLWKKLQPWVEALRTEMDDPYTFEWFQWLALTLENIEGNDDLPAYQSHTDWEPTKLHSEI